MSHVEVRPTAPASGHRARLLVGAGEFGWGSAGKLRHGWRRRVTYVVIVHRFGFAVEHGVDALLRVPLLAHRCDNPLCQNPRCWRESNHAINRREYVARRGSVLGALADVRGARGRAREMRDAARDGEDIDAAGLAGAREVHRAQLPMFAARAWASQ